MGDVSAMRACLCLSVCGAQLYIDFFKNITSTIAGALITAILCMAAIYSVKRWVDPKFKQKFKMPVPIELISVCIDQYASFPFCFRCESKFLYIYAVVSDESTSVLAVMVTDSTFSVLLNALLKLCLVDAREEKWIPQYGIVG